MTETTNKCAPKIPYTHTNYLCSISYKECCKPYDPANGRCTVLSLCFVPCSLVLDILCCIPMTFGCYNITPPE
jgi:hypothetical protein